MPEPNDFVGISVEDTCNWTYFMAARGLVTLAPSFVLLAQQNGDPKPKAGSGFREA